MAQGDQDYKIAAQRDYEDMRRFQRLFIDSDHAVRSLLKTLKEAVDELRSYAQARRDQSFKGWESTWKEIEIKHESDYEYYPNHVCRETIDDYDAVIEKMDQFIQIQSGSQPVGEKK
jgi:hypothetical protein